MSLRWRSVVVLLLMILVAGCEVPGLSHVGSPPPGWQSPVYNLLLDKSALPDGWQVGFYSPESAPTDSTINHVGQEWWNPAKGSSYISQSIWRTYSILDAKSKYSELYNSPVLLAHYTPSPDEFYVEFKPPSKINYQSTIADETYLACGWIVWAYCDVIARYRNYVVELLLPLETDYLGRVRYGLSFSEIEDILKSMDDQFTNFLNTVYVPTSSPWASYLSGIWEMV